MAIKKILVLGATGRTGQLLLKETLVRGYTVNCLARDKNKLIPKKKLTVFEGTPADKETLSKALKGCDAIVSVLNISRTSDFPWASLRTPKNFLSDTMKNIIELGEAHEIKRVIICSAWGVGDTFFELPSWFQWLIKNSNIGAAYEDHQKQEELFLSSKLKGTIVRPVALTNVKKIEEVVVSYNNIPKPKWTISRTAVAGFMLKALEDDGLIGKVPTIFSK